jgi:hypothetical protein
MEKITDIMPIDHVELLPQQMESFNKTLLNYKKAQQLIDSTG